MPANLHILSMLIQNADRTTYGINKIVVFVLAFVVFFVVGFVSWQWDGVAPEPWRLRTLVLTPLTMSLLLYVCCDQFGVYYRCQTLWESIRRFCGGICLFCGVKRDDMEVLCSLLRGCRCPDPGVSAYLSGFPLAAYQPVPGGKKRLVEEAPTLVVGTPDHVKRIPQDAGEQSCGLQEWAAGHGA